MSRNILVVGRLQYGGVEAQKNYLKNYIFLKYLLKQRQNFKSSEY